ncbi:hypothetical protein ASPBRDRAFT_484273 [Aspergillus brasiliensis CBS 101740]|uniref:Uncharacterized protein n=1 Tax=Aspergillus brasiliensis (strain CBS 101740 / IMI 381727 / IBT 21946) TaxID=767769 RepID=A0A1L9UUD7_ASPBC|nr:hypothetical protein ASPBRDRAFT_484273 [Aspergillus brasiliensis CBS 101740]
MEKIRCIPHWSAPQPHCRYLTCGVPPHLLYQPSSSPPLRWIGKDLQAGFSQLNCKVYHLPHHQPLICDILQAYCLIRSALRSSTSSQYSRVQEPPIYSMVAPMSNNSTCTTTSTVAATTHGIVHGWVYRPNCRGTIDIIWSGLFTIFICTYTMLCLNVPAQNEKPWDIIRRQLFWMAVAISGPLLTCLWGMQYVFVHKHGCVLDL